MTARLLRRSDVAYTQTEQQSHCSISGKDPCWSRSRQSAFRLSSSTPIRSRSWHSATCQHRSAMGVKTGHSPPRPLLLKQTFSFPVCNPFPVRLQCRVRSHPLAPTFRTFKRRLSSNYLSPNRSFTDSNFLAAVILRPLTAAHFDSPGLLVTGHLRLRQLDRVTNSESSR